MENQRNNSSSFLFGLLIGAIIGAIIAIYIYKNKKSKVLSDFQKYFHDYLKKLTKNFTPEPAHIKTASVAAAAKPRPKMFVKK